MTMESTQLFILIIQGLSTIVFAGIGFAMKVVFDRIKSLESDMNGMKLNYLDRFKEVIKNQTEAKEALTSSQNNIKEELISQQTKVKEELVQHYSITKEELVNALHNLTVAFAEHTATGKSRTKK